ncbi:MAG: hypothetical protein KC910_20810, partial [Candidatus Eremiobacteraeota bacterium]|nr:hypothetical protein [Candidatus Eremiobacteraeota bacterium]
AIVVHPSMMATPLLYYGFAPDRLRPIDSLDPTELADLASYKAIYVVTTPAHPFVARAQLEARSLSGWKQTGSQEFRSYLPSGWIRITRYEPPNSH